MAKVDQLIYRNVELLDITKSTDFLWCRERGLNPRPSDVSDIEGAFAPHMFLRTAL